MPIEISKSLITVQFQKGSLLERNITGQLRCFLLIQSPFFCQILRQLEYSLRLFCTWTKIISLSIFRLVLIEILSQSKITTQWFQYMLPRTGSLRATDFYSFSLRECLNTIYNNTIFSPISTTDDITSASHTHLDIWHVLNERIPIATDC